MAKARIMSVLPGRINPDAIYVMSASGNIYRLKPTVAAAQRKVHNIDTATLIQRTKERGTIDTKFFTKGRGGK